MPPMTTAMAEETTPRIQNRKPKARSPSSFDLEFELNQTQTEENDEGSDYDSNKTVKTANKSKDKPISGVKSIFNCFRSRLYHFVPCLEQVEIWFMGLSCHGKAIIVCLWIVVKFSVSFFAMSMLFGVYQHHRVFSLEQFHYDLVHNDYGHLGVGGKGGKNANSVKIDQRHDKINKIRHDNKDAKKLVAVYQSTDENVKFRVLHIVTTLAEYNNGRRGTKHGEDRLMELLLPVLQYNVESLLTREDWEVDIYLVLGFKLLPERRKLLEEALPDGIGLEVWDNATPYSYDVRSGKKDDHLTEITRALARQHRFVLKDKLEEYDLFSIWVSFPAM